MWWFIALLLPLKTYAYVDILHTNLHTGIQSTGPVQYFSLINYASSHTEISVVITHDSGSTTTITVPANTLANSDPRAVSSDPDSFNGIWYNFFAYPSLTSPTTFAAVNAATSITVTEDGVTQTVDLQALESSLGQISNEYQFFQNYGSWSLEQGTPPTTPTTPTGLIVSTNLHTASSSSDVPQFIRILNDNGVELDSSETQQFSIEILDSSANPLSTVTFPPTTWTVDGYLILSSDASAFDSDFSTHFFQNAETDSFWSAVEQPRYLELYYGSELLEFVDLADTSTFTTTLDSSNYEYYDYNAGLWSIVSAGGGGTSSSASASASPAPASASPSPTGCQPGVWDQGESYATQNGVVPFGPQLIAQGADRTRLVWDGSLTDSAIQFRVRFADWHDTYSLTTSVCNGTDTAETVPHTEPEGCGYTIYEASFPLSTCPFEVMTDGDFRTVSGFVVATANMTTTFLGTSFDRTFRLPLGFFFTLSTSFDTSNTITIQESNNCYDEGDCNQFACTPDQDAPNVCDCFTNYGSGKHGTGTTENTEINDHCVQQEHSGNKCQTDGVPPFCSVPGPLITVTYTTQDTPTQISLETNSDTTWFNPFWDDCDAPFNSSLHDIASVVYTIQGSILTDLDTVDSSLGKVYTDSTVIPATTFATVQDQTSNTITYNIEYGVLDLSGNGADLCYFSITVIDNAAPVCGGTSEVLPGIMRGTLKSDWEIADDSWTLFPNSFPTTDNTLAEDLVPETDYAEEMKDWAVANCWDASTGDHLPTDAQGYASCERLEVEHGGTTATVDLRTLYENAADFTTFVTGLPSAIANVLGSNFACNANDFPGFVGNLNNCLKEGDYTAKLVVVDGAAQEKECGESSFTIDNTPPAVDCPPGVVEWTSYIRLEGSHGTNWESYANSFGIDNMHSVYQVPTTEDSAYTPQLDSTYFDFSESDAVAGIQTTTVYAWALTDDQIVKTVNTLYTDLASLYNIQLQHPQSFRDTINQTANTLDTDLARLYVVYAVQDSVGNANLCSVQYEVQDTTPVTDFNCVSATHDLTEDLASHGQMTTHPFSLDNLTALFSASDFQKQSTVWDTNAGAASAIITATSFDYCELQWASRFVSNYDANQGRDNTTSRRLLAEYPTDATSCDDYYAQAASANGVYELTVSSTQSLENSATVDIWAPGTDPLIQLHRQTSVDVAFTFDNQLDYVVTAKNVTSDDGILATRDENPSSGACAQDPVVEIRDVDVPTIQDACNIAFIDPLHVMDQANNCSDFGIAQDAVNYVKMSATVQDNGQLYAGGIYEYVHLEPSYLGTPGVGDSTSCFYRGTETVTYTFEDASGNEVSCDKDISINDLAPPTPVYDSCDLSLSVDDTTLVVMDTNASSATQALSFQVTERQGVFGTDWDITIAGNALPVTNNSMDDTCAFTEAPSCTYTNNGIWDCTASVTLSKPGKTYFCTMTFTELTYVPTPSNLRPSDETCSFRLSLDDTQNPELTCPYEDASSAYVIAYSDYQDHFTGTVDVSYTVADNAGIYSNATNLDSGYLNRIHSVQFTDVDRDGNGFSVPPLYDTQTVNGSKYYLSAITESDAFGNTDTCIIWYRFEDQEAPGLVCDYDGGSVTVKQSHLSGSGSDSLEFNRNDTEGVPVSPFYTLWDNSYDASDLSAVSLAITLASSENGTSKLDDWRHVYDRFLFPTTTDVAESTSANTAQLALYSLWIHDINVTLTATDADGNSANCTFTIKFEDEDKPVLDACQVTTFTVNDSEEYIDDEQVTLHSLWDLTTEGYPNVGVALGDGKDTVTLPDPQTHCEPAEDNELDWCPTYTDALGGTYNTTLGIYIQDGNVTYIVSGPAGRVIPIQEATTFTFSADDRYGTGDDADDLDCTFTVEDDVVPGWIHCGSDPVDSSTSSSYSLSLTLQSSNLTSSGKPEDSSWSWTDTSVRGVVKGLFDVDLPMPQDNTNGDYMDDSAGESQLTNLLTSTYFLQGSGVGAEFVTHEPSGTVTVTDKGSNTATCSVTYTLDDNVLPTVECTSALTPTYYLSNCSTSVSFNLTSSPKTGCDHTIQYTVNEDIALAALCTEYDQNTSSCTTGTEKDISNELKTNTKTYTGITEPLYNVVPPYIENISPTSTSNSVTEQRNQTIEDWDSNSAIEVCETTIEIRDNVAPVPLHAHETNGAGYSDFDTCHEDAETAAGANQRGIRLLQNQTSLTLPWALLPVPWARDAAHVTATISRTSSDGTTDPSDEVVNDSENEVYSDHGLRENLEAGTYNFTYTYTDSSGNESPCHWQIRVYSSYADPQADVFTVLYYADQGTNTRRRAILASPESSHQLAPLRQLLQTTPTFDTGASTSLTLQYVVTSTYPYRAKDSGVSVGTNDTTTYETSVTFVDARNCGDDRSYSNADEGGDWYDQSGVCFKTYEISKTGINCDYAAETITITHELECAPNPESDYHYSVHNNGYDEQTSTAANECVEEDTGRTVTVEVLAQDFCYQAVSTVTTSATLYFGDYEWATGIMNTAQGSKGSKGTYWSETVDESLSILNYQEADDNVTVTLCGIVHITVPDQEEGSVQIDSLDLTSVTSADFSSWGLLSTTVHYTNIIGFCANVALPDITAAVGPYTSQVTVNIEGTVDYNIQGVQRRRSILYEENAEFQVSEVYSFTATRGADDDPFFTPNTGAVTESKSAASWAVPVGIAAFFVLCVCAGCSFMGYRSCLWAKEIVQSNTHDAQKSLTLPELPGPSASELQHLKGDAAQESISMSTLGRRAEVYSDTPW